MSTQSPFTPADSLSLVEETAIGAGYSELAFTAEQLDSFDTNFLRNLAAHVETDEINGKSTRLEMVSFFKCQRSLTEYTE